MTKLDERARYTFRLPTGLLEQLKTEANKTGHSVNALILQILWEWEKQQEKKQAKKAG